MEDDEYNKMWLNLLNNIKEIVYKCELDFYVEICEIIDNIYKNFFNQEQGYKV